MTNLTSHRVCFESFLKNPLFLATYLIHWCCMWYDVANWHHFLSLAYICTLSHSPYVCVLLKTLAIKLATWEETRRSGDFLYTRSVKAKDGLSFISDSIVFGCVNYHKKSCVIDWCFFLNIFGIKYFSKRELLLVLQFSFSIRNFLESVNLLESFRELLESARGQKIAKATRKVTSW